LLELFEVLHFAAGGRRRCGGPSSISETYQYYFLQKTARLFKKQNIHSYQYWSTISTEKKTALELERKKNSEI